jgi:Methyltransferase domain
VSEERSTATLARPASDHAAHALSVKGRIKRMLGPEWQFRAHRAARLRWLTKYRALRDLDADVGLRTKLAFVLWDPEIESYSYELEDEVAFVRELADVFGEPRARLRRFAEETRQDPELNERLARHNRWRFDVKRRPPLGHRLAWYLAVRARRPAVVVETGIYRGLGSLVLLRALERNRQEGFPGELISFDIHPAAGDLVRPELRRGWRRWIGSTQDLLPAALEGMQVEMLFQDTPHTEANQSLEFGTALEHAGERLLLIDGSGGEAPTLRRLTSEYGGWYSRVRAPSRDHVYRGSNVALGMFDSD